ncbi:MAG: MarR family winged helix-turn-helix transcriptional regulator [Candidatus Scatosoma sp.]
MDGKCGKGSAEERSGKRKDAGVYFKKITERLQAYADRRGYRHDVTYAQGKVLFYLHTQKGGEATMKSVENYLDVSHATVSGIVSRLKEKGYVECEKSKEDARAKTVRLTEKEYASFAEMKKRRADMEKMLLKNFSDKERDELFFYLERVYKNVREAAEDDLPCKERRSGDGEGNKA